MKRLIKRFAEWVLKSEIDSLINDKAKMLEVELKVIENDLSVRETERLCKNCDKKKDDQKKEKVTPVKKPSYFSEVELALSEYLGRKVIVTKGKDDNHGTLSIDFYSQDELKELANILRREEVKKWLQKKLF